MRMLLLMSLMVSTATATPVSFTHQGRYLDGAGVPINGDFTVTFTLWDSAVDGSSVHSETETLPVSGGYLAHLLGSAGDLDHSEIPTTGLWIQVEIGGTNLGRQPVGMVPLAAVAASSLADDCAPGWVDIGPTCVQDTDSAGRTYGDAISYCYAQSARVCDQQDHVVICKESASLGLSYANQQWYWTGDRHWERYESGVTYPAHAVARRYGAGDLSLIHI